MGKTVMVLGGGIGGVATATRLRRLLPREHRSPGRLLHFTKVLHEKCGCTDGFEEGPDHV